MLNNNTHSNVMNKIQYYAKNISGTNSYWYQVKQQLKSMLEQVGSPTIFFTLSCAEFHWPEFHAVFGEVDNDSTDHRKNVSQYPHILDWFFIQRVESFIKHWLYNTLGAIWHWYRFEFALLRGAIHCHGLAKLQSDFDICEHTSKAIKAFECQEKIDLGLVDIDSCQQILQEGHDAERKVCDYYDYLISCMNPVSYEEWVKPLIHPCKVKYEDAVESIDEDYAALLNSVQRHTKCNSGYVLRTNSEGEQYCRFHYPFELQDETRFHYKKVTNKSGTTIRPELIAKRNDPRLNRHQQIQIQGWRANCDIQLVIDHHACVEYLAKYAAKGEKMSSIARDAFVAVMSNINDTSSPHSIIKKMLVNVIQENKKSCIKCYH